MIVKELFAIRDDGVKQYRTYSDIGVYIIRDGILYEDAIDPEGTEERVYGETNAMIPIVQIPESTDNEEEDGAEDV